MQVTFERSGGLMGLKSSLTIHLDDLPPDQAQALHQLLDEANFFVLPENSPTHTNTDGFQYTITVETKMVRHTIHTSDTTAPKELQPLLQELSRRARVQQRRR